MPGASMKRILTAHSQRMTIVWKKILSFFPWLLDFTTYKIIKPYALATFPYAPATVPYAIA